MRLLVDRSTVEVFVMGGSRCLLSHVPAERALCAGHAHRSARVGFGGNERLSGRLLDGLRLDRGAVPAAPDNAMSGVPSSACIAQVSFEQTPTVSASALVQSRNVQP